MPTTQTTALTTDQAQRAEALEKARHVLNATTGLAASSPGLPEDLVALARFIVDGVDLYQGEETVLEADFVDETSAFDAVDLYKEGDAYLVLPGAGASGSLYRVPAEGTVVTVRESGIDSDGDVYVTTDAGAPAWVKPRFLQGVGR